jgi:hypothetical protein
MSGKRIVEFGCRSTSQSKHGWEGRMEDIVTSFQPNEADKMTYKPFYFEIHRRRRWKLETAIGAHQTV